MIVIYDVHDSIWYLPSIHRSLDSSPRWWWLFSKSQKLARIFQSLKAVLFRSDKPMKTSDVDFQLYTFVAFGVWSAYLPSKSDPCAICACWYRKKNLNSSPTAMLPSKNLSWKSSPGRRGFRGPPTEKKISGRKITSWKFGLVILKKFSMVGANCAFRGSFSGPRNFFDKVKEVVLIPPTTGHWQHGNEVCFWRPFGSAIRWWLGEVIFLEIWGFVNLPRLFWACEFDLPSFHSNTS